MTNNEKYNGWSNYETWLFWLWRGDGIDTVADLNAAKEEVEAQVENGEPTFFTDILSTAIDAINWQELKAHIKES